MHPDILAGREIVMERNRAQLRRELAAREKTTQCDNCLHLDECPAWSQEEAEEDLCYLWQHESSQCSQCLRASDCPDRGAHRRPCHAKDIPEEEEPDQAEAQP